MTNKEDFINSLIKDKTLFRNVFGREKVIEETVNFMWNKDKKGLIRSILHYKNLYYNADEAWRNAALEVEQLLKLVEWTWVKLNILNQDLARELEKRLNEIGYKIVLCENCKYPYSLCTCGND